ncbi:hypothetical protein [Abditibacterium utsteinense]|uniref:hypothetical protein n=1 Tax=Abditibacterium utsteinense TaxID=1960156 RepID=UPI000CFE32AF|nr:hypothetical protein [Abditibacterium utsteinense]
MQVTFQPDWRDNRAAARFINPPPLRTLCLKWLVVAALILPHGLGGWKGLAVGVFFTLIWDVDFYLTRRRRHKSSFAKYPILSQTHIISVTDEGFGIYLGAAEPLPWSCVDRIVETRTRYLVVVLLQPEIYGREFQNAVAIPKRAFDSPAQCANFGALLKQKWAQHRNDIASIASAK